MSMISDLKKQIEIQKAAKMHQTLLEKTVSGLMLPSGVSPAASQPASPFATPEANIPTPPAPAPLPVAKKKSLAMPIAIVGGGLVLTIIIIAVIRH